LFALGDEIVTADGGWLAGQHEVADGPQGEQVQLDRVRSRGHARLGGEIDFLDQPIREHLDMEGPSGLALGLLQLPGGDLPIEEDDIEGLRPGGAHQDGLGRQAAMVQAVAMGRVQGFGDGAHQLQPLPQIEPFALGADVVIQPLQAFVIVEDEGGTLFAVDKVGRG
jgi:hypothetical protein